jgi:cytochrome bd-type quinol oxidase subunit 1
MLLALYCGAQGVSTMAIDLNRTHACNPQWTGHARFHVVWQVATTALLAIVEIVVLLASGPWELERFYLCVILAALPMAGFFVALAAKKIYKGTLSDSNGIQPWIIRTKKSSYAIDLSVVAEIAAFVFLVVLTLYFQHEFNLSRN